MLNIGICGANGKIGRLLIEIIQEDNDTNLSCIYVRNVSKYQVPKDTLVTNDIIVLLETSDLVIDFSSPEATTMLLNVAISKYHKPIVIGTTGLDKFQQNLMISASQKMPILYASNMSKGIVVLNRLVQIVSNALKNSDIEIIEMHHRDKKDAPSGTALRLAKTCAEARNLDIDKVRISQRDGIIGKRSKDEIAVMSMRGGDIVGRHSVGFYLDGEYIELIHNATNRIMFANGAVDAGKWLIKQKNGFYGIEDVLKL